VKNEAKSIDVSGLKLVAMRDAKSALAAGATRLVIAENCVVTPSARDFLSQHNIDVVTGCSVKAASSTQTTPAAYGVAKPVGNSSAVQGRPAANPRLFFTPEAEAVKKEICEVGRKLWMRQFVDGNGGNISYRIGPNEVICTPTLVSKFDLQPEDLSMVDLDGNQIAGTKPRTSEIFLHLEIYKAVPEAKSAVHCHPPHATAYAITGRVPPNLVIPEFEVFVGKVALSPYATPGTQEFAETVLPYVKEHNTVLLANHGIICWADSVTHAEWYAEVLDTYCWTLMLASQLGAPISYMTEKQGTDLLDIKKRLGLPDARFDTSKMKECQLADVDAQGSIAVTPNSCWSKTSNPADADMNSLIKAITDAVMEEINQK
jgi:L-fuculose-phosphate aldolase